MGVHDTHCSPGSPPRLRGGTQPVSAASLGRAGLGGSPTQSPGTRCCCQRRGESLPPICRWDALPTTDASPPLLKPGLKNQETNQPGTPRGFPPPAKASCSSPNGHILAASSLRPVTHTLTDDLCLQLAVDDFPLLFLLKPQPQPYHELPTALQVPSRPPQSGEAPRHAQERNSHPGSGAQRRAIPEHHSRSLWGDRAAAPAPPYPAVLKAAAKGEEDCTSQNLPAELLLLGELFTSLGSVALQGKVHPHRECFTSEAIYRLQGR